MRNKMPPENQKIMLVICELSIRRYGWLTVLESQSDQYSPGDEIEASELLSEHDYIEVMIVGNTD